MLLDGGELLGSVLTSRLPIPKITSWNVEVMKQYEPTPKSDWAIVNLYNSVVNTIDSLKTAINSIFDEDAGKWEKIASFDSCLSVNGVHDSQIVQNVIESSTFRSVNKIRKPNIITVELGKGGYSSLVEQVMERLKKYKGSTALCRVSTPFGVLSNLNLIKLDYSFTRENGANLLVARLTFQEVMFNQGTEKKKKGLFEGILDFGKKYFQEKG